MVLARELAVRPLDLLGRRRPRDAQHLVVVAELHRHGSISLRAVATTTWAGRSNSLPSRQPRRISRTTVPGSAPSAGTVATASCTSGRTAARRSPPARLQPRAGAEQEPLRGRHALVERGVRGAGGERALERVEDGQKGEHRRALPVAPGDLLLACHAPAEVLEVGQQPEILLLLRSERVTETLDVGRLDGLLARIGLRRVHGSIIPLRPARAAPRSRPSAPPRRCGRPPARP